MFRPIRRILFLWLFVVACCSVVVDGFGCVSLSNHGYPQTLSWSKGSVMFLEAASVDYQQENHEKDASVDVSQQRRRQLLSYSVAAAFSLFITATAPPPAVAADKAASTIWNTGKRPRVPGAKVPDKSDTRGTRKDPSFLRSLSDCKNQCETNLGPDGLARPKDDCLSDCQDICCTTYEQCTFAIVPRI